MHTLKLSGDVHLPFVYCRFAYMPTVSAMASRVFLVLTNVRFASVAEFRRVRHSLLERHSLICMWLDGLLLPLAGVLSEREHADARHRINWFLHRTTTSLLVLWFCEVD